MYSAVNSLYKLGIEMGANKLRSQCFYWSSISTRFATNRIAIGVKCFVHKKLACHLHHYSTILSIISNMLGAIVVQLPWLCIESILRAAIGQINHNSWFDPSSKIKTLFLNFNHNMTQYMKHVSFLILVNPTPTHRSIKDSDWKWSKNMYLALLF